MVGGWCLVVEGVGGGRWLVAGGREVEPELWPKGSTDFHRETDDDRNP